MITLYRYHVSRGYNTPNRESVELVLEEFIVIKETACGYWYIPKPFFNGHRDPQTYNKRWVSSTARKRHCYPTTEEAFNSFSIRTRLRAGYLRSDLEMVENALLLTQDQTTMNISQEPHLTF